LTHTDENPTIPPMHDRTQTQRTRRPPATVIAHGDPRLGWEGAVTVERTARWSQPWRVPHAQRGLFHPELVTRAGMAAGVRLRFRTDATCIAGRVERQGFEHPIDLCVDGRLAGSSRIDEQGRFVFDALPAGRKLCEIWLPQFGAFRLHELRLSPGAGLARAPDRRRRWVTYGSSITHCRQAASPTATWPSIVARDRDVHLTCLGYGGQCHLDVMVARMIRDLHADFLSLCVGINIHGGSLSPRTFGSGIVGFVQVIRERHPVTPIAVMSPIFSPDRETTPNAAGWTLPRMRDAVRDAVATLRAHGDVHVHAIDGLAILGAKHADRLPDRLHPDTEGYALMARNFLRRAAPVLGM
jgi:hypothetical protein